MTNAATERSPEATKLHGSEAILLASGLILLEFAAAVSTFVAGTLLPLIEKDLKAQQHLPLLVAGTMVGMFAALPFSSRIIARFPPSRVLLGGTLASVAGYAIAASASTPWVFALGRFITGFAGAVVAVYGVSAAIRHLDDSLRLKVVGVMSAMWILPATVGPSITLGLNYLIGWRLTLFAPLPLLLIGRLIVVRAVPPQQPSAAPERPLVGTLLVPIGVAAYVLLAGSSVWYLAPVAAVVAIVGFFVLMPTGTGRLRRGAPAGLAGLTLFGVGYFGASNLITLLFTQTYETSLYEAGIAVSAAPIVWALASMIAPRIGPGGAPPEWGMALAAAGVGAVAVFGLLGGPWIVGLLAWTLTGLGVGLAYPAMYVRATTEDETISATQLATAAITTESFGSLIGSTAGAGFGSISDALGLSRSDAWCWSFIGFAVFLGAAAVAARRTLRSETKSDSGGER